MSEEKENYSITVCTHEGVQHFVTDHWDFKDSVLTFIHEGTDHAFHGMPFHVTSKVPPKDKGFGGNWI